MEMVEGDNILETRANLWRLQNPLFSGCTLQTYERDKEKVHKNPKSQVQLMFDATSEFYINMQQKQTIKSSKNRQNRYQPSQPIPFIGFCFSKWKMKFSICRYHGWGGMGCTTIASQQQLQLFSIKPQRTRWLNYFILVWVCKFTVSSWRNIIFHIVKWCSQPTPVDRLGCFFCCHDVSVEYRARMVIKSHRGIWIISLRQRQDNIKLSTMWWRRNSEML